MTLGSLSVTGNNFYRKEYSGLLANVNFFPYPVGSIKRIDTINYLESVLNDRHSGIERPAAIILETVQAEGGVMVAPVEWLREIRRICTEYDILMICDDIQVGCYRTGAFFSFERAGIVPDIVTLSKSISGYGFPMSLVLIKPEHDCWEPGEHSGTFRGNQIAFISARAAIEFAERFEIENMVKERSIYIKEFIEKNLQPLSEAFDFRGIGMIWGIDFSKVGGGEMVDKIAMKCFNDGLMVENCGRKGAVIKILPALTIDMMLLKEGFEILENAIRELLPFRPAGLTKSLVPPTVA